MRTGRVWLTVSSLQPFLWHHPSYSSVIKICVKARLALVLTRTVASSRPSFTRAAVFPARRRSGVVFGPTRSRAGAECSDEDADRRLKYHSHASTCLSHVWFGSGSGYRRSWEILFSLCSRFLFTLTQMNQLVGRICISICRTRCVLFLTRCTRPHKCVRSHDCKWWMTARIIFHYSVPSVFCTQRLRPNSLTFTIQFSLSFNVGTVVFLSTKQLVLNSMKTFARLYRTQYY